MGYRTPESTSLTYKMATCFYDTHVFFVTKGQLIWCTVKIFILGCNYSETEVYWTGTKLEHLGFLGVSQFCSGPEQFCWGRIFIPIPTPPRCIVHLWAKKIRRTPRFFLTRHGYPPKTMLVRNKTGTIDDFLGCSSFVPVQNKYFYGIPCREHVFGMVPGYIVTVHLGG